MDCRFPTATATGSEKIHTMHTCCHSPARTGASTALLHADLIKANERTTGQAAGFRALEKNLSELLGAQA